MEDRDSATAITTSARVIAETEKVHLASAHATPRRSLPCPLRCRQVPAGSQPNPVPAAKLPSLADEPPHQPNSTLAVSPRLRTQSHQDWLARQLVVLQSIQPCTKYATNSASQPRSLTRRSPVIARYCGRDRWRGRLSRHLSAQSTKITSIWTSRRRGNRTSVRPCRPTPGHGRLPSDATITPPPVRDSCDRTEP